MVCDDTHNMLCRMFEHQYGNTSMNIAIACHLMILDLPLKFAPSIHVFNAKNITRSNIRYPSYGEDKMQIFRGNTDIHVTQTTIHLPLPHPMKQRDAQSLSSHQNPVRRNIVSCLENPKNVNIVPRERFLRTTSAQPQLSSRQKC